MRYEGLQAQECPRCHNGQCNLVAEKGGFRRFEEYLLCSDCGWTGKAVYDVAYLHTTESDEETLREGVGEYECPECHAEVRAFVEWLFDGSYIKEVRCTGCGWEGVKAFEAVYSHTEDVGFGGSAAVDPEAFQSEMTDDLNRTMIEVFSTDDGVKLIRYLGYTCAMRADDGSVDAQLIEYPDFVVSMDGALDAGGASKYEALHQAEVEKTRRAIDLERAYDVSRWYREGMVASRITGFSVNEELADGFYLIYAEF